MSDEIEAKRQKAHRVLARSFARLAKTDDGKRALKFLDEAFGWDQAGPGQDISTETLQGWVGQRSVLKAIKDQISSGERLLANPESNDHESD